jgi:transposase-like protein
VDNFNKKSKEMTVEERFRRRFSEEFRKKIVRLIENKELTMVEAGRLYEVKPASIKRWVVKYGKGDYPKPIVIQGVKDVNRLRDLEKENRRLKEMIGNQQVQLVYQAELIKLAKEHLGEDFEKKCKSHY